MQTHTVLMETDARTVAYTIINILNLLTKDRPGMHKHTSPLTLIFITFATASALTVSPASLVLNVSGMGGLHRPGVYTVTGHDLISVAISLASPSR